MQREINILRRQQNKVKPRYSTVSVKKYMGHNHLLPYLKEMDSFGEISGWVFATLSRDCSLPKFVSAKPRSQLTVNHVINHVKLLLAPPLCACHIYPFLGDSYATTKPRRLHACSRTT